VDYYFPYLSCLVGLFTVLLTYMSNTIDGDFSLQATTNESAATPTEQHLRQTDEIFTRLTDLVSQSPEAKQQALTTLISQMQQVADQMRTVRDMENMQELKLKMMGFWNEIQQAAAGNTELERAIYDWADKFNQEKVLFHDNILEVKDELIDANQEMQDVWSEVVMLLGQIAAKSSDFKSIGRLKAILFKRNKNLARFERTLETKHLRNRASSMDDFAASVDDLTSVYEGDLDMEASRDARATINNALFEVATAVGKSENSEKLEGDMHLLNEKIEQLHEKIRNIIKIYMVAKKIRDIRFDKVINQRPPHLQSA